MSKEENIGRARSLYVAEFDAGWKLFQLFQFSETKIDGDGQIWRISNSWMVPYQEPAAYARSAMTAIWLWIIFLKTGNDANGFIGPPSTKHQMLIKPEFYWIQETNILSIDNVNEERPFGYRSNPESFIRCDGKPTARGFLDTVAKAGEPKKMPRLFL